jgi:hypothetical protein
MRPKPRSDILHSPADDITARQLDHYAVSTRHRWREGAESAQPRCYAGAVLHIIKTREHPSCILRRR